MGIQDKMYFVNKVENIVGKSRKNTIFANLIILQLYYNEKK